MKLATLLADIEVKKIYGREDVEIEDLAYHSKRVNDQSLFVSIKGSKQDGHHYIDEAIKKGAIAIVLNQSLAHYDPLVTYIFVEDPKKVLALLSIRFFNDPSKHLTMIGITGTKGKTTSAMMIYHCLKAAGYQVGVIGTNGVYYQNHHEETKNTTPESYDLQKYLAMMVKAGCQCVVMEVTSLGIKQKRVDGITFDIGCFTNLSYDHIGPLEHHDFEEYRDCKKELLKRSRFCFICQDDPYSKEMISSLEVPYQFYSLIEVENITYCDQPHLAMHFDYQQKNYSLPFPGIFNILNALLCIHVCHYIGVPKDVIKAELAHITIKGRSEYVETYPGVSVYIDYAHNASSMENILKTMQCFKYQRLITVFGCGGHRDRHRRFEMGRLSGKYATLSILTSDNSRQEKTEDIIDDIVSGIKKTNGAYKIIPDRKKAIEFVLQESKPGDMILILGKGHERYQEINGVKKEFIERKIIMEYLNKE